MSTNFYATAGRAVKTLRIVTAVDAELAVARIGTNSPAVLIKLIARLEAMTSKEWSRLCAKHDIRKPSAETTACVIAAFRERLETIKATRAVA